MIKHLVVVLSVFLATAAMAEGPTCNATATCQAASKEKKLSGAAKSSFEEKCIKDAVG